MSHQPPDIDEVSFTNQGSNKVDAYLKWSVPGPGAIIPGDTPDKFRISVNGQFFKEVDASETELTIPGLPRPGSYIFTVCCWWNATREDFSDEQCSSEIAQLPSLPDGGGRWGGGDQLPVPVITAREARPATLSQENSIKISWSSAYDYDVYLVRWAGPYTPRGMEAQITIETSGYTGSFVLQPTRPGETYRFVVEGGDKGLVGVAYSGWSAEVEVTARQNLSSLREFLMLSGIDPTAQDLRSLMPPGITLRKFMKL